MVKHLLSLLWIKCSKSRFLTRCKINIKTFNRQVKKYKRFPRKKKNGLGRKQHLVKVEGASDGHTHNGTYGKATPLKMLCKNDHKILIKKSHTD